jgi:hypothetical protein
MFSFVFFLHHFSVAKKSQRWFTTYIEPMMYVVTVAKHIKNPTEHPQNHDGWQKQEEAKFLHRATSLILMTVVVRVTSRSHKEGWSLINLSRIANLMASALVG